MLLDVLSVTFFGGSSVLTRVSVMGAASENGMQQHCRHCQNAGQVAEHRGFHRRGGDNLRRDPRPSITHISSSTQTGLSLEREIA
jgi:hypothetical protein